VAKSTGDSFEVRDDSHRFHLYNILAREVENHLFKDLNRKLGQVE